MSVALTRSVVFTNMLCESIPVRCVVWAYLCPFFLSVVAVIMVMEVDATTGTSRFPEVLGRMVGTN